MTSRLPKKRRITPPSISRATSFGAFLSALACGLLASATFSFASDSLQWGGKAGSSLAAQSSSVPRRAVDSSMFRDPKLAAAAWEEESGPALVPELAGPNLNQPQSITGPSFVSEIPEAETAPVPESTEQQLEELRMAQVPADPFDELADEPADIFDENVDLFGGQEELEEVQEAVEDEMVRREETKVSQSWADNDDYDLFDDPTSEAAAGSEDLIPPGNSTPEVDLFEDDPTGVGLGGAQSDLQRRLESSPNIVEAPEVGDSELFESMTNEEDDIFNTDEADDREPQGDLILDDVDDWIDLNLLQPGKEELTEQQRKILESEREENEQSCQEEIEKLQAQRLENIDLSIRIEGQPGKDFPFECSLRNEKYEERSWPQLTYMWKASGLCHKPLYFEQVHLERHGHTWGPYTQPLLSGVHFFGTIPILPYKMGLKTPNECVYTLGHYRPGNCAPYLIDRLPVTWRAIGFQTGAATGLSFLVP